jgi:hypothetical protein
MNTCIASKPTRRQFGGYRRPERKIQADPITVPATTTATLETGDAPRLQPLRRWSVAELIARAAVAPPRDGVTRG